MQLAFLVSQVWLSERQTHAEALVIFVWFYVFFTLHISDLKSFCLQMRYFCLWLQMLSTLSSFKSMLWQNIRSLFESCGFRLSHCRWMSSFTLCPYSVIMDAMHSLLYCQQLAFLAVTSSQAQLTRAFLDLWILETEILHPHLISNKQGCSKNCLFSKTLLHCYAVFSYLFGMV